MGEGRELCYMNVDVNVYFEFYITNSKYVGRGLLRIFIMRFYLEFYKKAMITLQVDISKGAV